MKKYIALIMIVLMLSVAPVQGFAPLGIPAYYLVASAALHVAGAAAGLYYAMKPDTKPAVSSTGDVSRSSSVTWVDLTSDTPAVVEKSVTAKKDHSTVKSTVTKSVSDYPSLNAALVVPPVTVVNGLVGETVVGPNGTPVKISSMTFGSINNADLGALIWNTWEGGGPFSYRVITTSGQYISQYKVVVAVATAGPLPAAVPATPEQFSASIRNPDGTPKTSALEAELNKMMQDPDYVPTFTDDTTGLPWTPPPSSQVATPSQVAAYNAQGAAQAAAQTAATSSVTAAQAAGAAYTASGGDIATGIGGDSALYRAYLNAQAQADRDAAALAALEADYTDDDDGTALSGATFNGSAAYGDSNVFDFGQRFQTFFNEMRQTAVFSLPNQFLTSIPNSSTSVITFSGGRFGTHSFDFASLSAVWIGLKAVILVIFGWLSIRIAILKGGSS